MYYLGLDLGKARDFTALAVVERRERQRSVELVVRYLERAPLGTPYTRVVERVAELTRHRNLNGLCQLVVDATGVGVPVVEALRKTPMGCRGITAVTITAGETVRPAAGFGVGEHWNVPRKDLLAGLQLLLEKGELKIAKKMRESGVLVRELVGMRTRVGPDTGVHDDLVLAVSLACWQAMRAKNGMGMVRLF